MKPLAAALVVAAGWLPAQALAATVHGAIVQRSIRDVRPVPNLLVTMKSSANVRSARIYTDRVGEFWFYNVPRGRYLLEIWRNGLDENNTRTLETCQIDVGADDVALPALRLHNSPLKPRSALKSCREGLEHLYIN
jgi:hypothetical protein